MLIEANMTAKERELDNKIKDLGNKVSILDKEYGVIKRKKHKNKKDLERIKEIEKEVGFYLIERNNLYEELKRGV